MKRNIWLWAIVMIVWAMVVVGCDSYDCQPQYLIKTGGQSTSYGKTTDIWVTKEGTKHHLPVSTQPAGTDTTVLKCVDR